MMRPLNSPLEVGVRAVFFLETAFPQKFDLNQLVLADHMMLHSEDAGGPPSLHPSLAIREGELGVRRKLVHAALEQMEHFGLVRLTSSDAGVLFGAAGRAYGFVRLFESSYAARLSRVSKWVAEEIGDESVHDSRRRMKSVISAWPESISQLQTSREVQ
jgi:hypothetical protein